MAITRRQFIKRTGLATAGAFFGPSLFGNPFVRQAMAQTIGDRYFVVLFLDGGNDGFNTVVPYGAGTLRTAYETYRNAGSLQLLPGDLDGTIPGTGGTLIGNDFNTGEQLALHPGFNGFPGVSAGAGGLKAIYDAGELAVIQGCGYPEYSLSHEQARAIWQTANPLGVSGYSGTGWVGRHLQSEYGAADIPSVNIESGVAPEFRQTTTSVLAIESLEDFGFPYDLEYPDDATLKEAAFNALYGARNRDSCRTSRTAGSRRSRARTATRPCTPSTRPTGASSTICTTGSTAARRATSGRSPRSSTACTRGSRACRLASSASPTAATTRTPTRAPHSRTASTSSCTPRSAPRSRSFATT